jgi:hypothetical protein
MNLLDPRHEVFVVLNAGPCAQENEPWMIATPARRKYFPFNADHFVRPDVRRIVHYTVYA